MFLPLLFKPPLELAESRRVKIKTQVADLERDYRIKSQNYDVILVFNYLQRDLFPQIRNGLKVGGMVVLRDFYPLTNLNSGILKTRIIYCSITSCWTIFVISGCCNTRKEFSASRLPGLRLSH